MTTRKQPKTAAEAIVGHLLSQMKDELNTIMDVNNPNQSVWGTQSEIQQAEILDRCKRRIRGALDAGFTELFAEGVPSVRATVNATNFKKKGIICTLEIPENAKYRHELADAAQGQVLIIITPDIDAYMKSAEMVKPDTDQKELPLDNSADPNELEDARTLKQLRKAAEKAAEAIDEKDVAEMVHDWDRNRLTEYLNFANAKLKESQKAVH